MNSLYRVIFRRVLKISWHHKWVWLLAFFAAFIGNGGVYEALLRGFNNVSEGQSIFFTLQEYARSGVWGMMSWSKLVNLWQTDPSAFGLSLLGSVTLLCVLAILIVLGVVSQAGVVYFMVKRDEGEEIGLMKSFRHGLERFWPVLEINVITKLVLLGILTLLTYVASVFYFNNSTWNTVVYIAAFVIFMLFGIIIYFLTIYGTAYAVLRDKNVWPAITAAWKLFKKHALLNLEMGLLLFVLNVLAAVVFFVVSFIVLSPLIILYFLLMFSGVNWGAAIIMGIATVIFVIAILLVGSWWSAFQLGVWAALFEELEVKGGQSKIVRWFEAARGHLSKKKKK